MLAGQRARLAVLAGLALFGGVAESIVLVVIVQAAVAVSAHSSASLHFGPVQIDVLKVSVLLLVALVGTMLRLGAAVGVAWFGAAMTADVQKRLRIAIFDAFIDAEWAAQSREREGGLQQIVGTEVDRATVAVLNLSMAVAAACSLVMLAFAAFLVSPVAAGALVGSVLGLFVLLRPLTGRVRRHASARSTEELSIAQSLNELVRTAEEVRVHGVSGEQKRRLAAETSRIRDWVARLNFNSLSLSNLYQAAALCVVVGALFVVSRLDARSIAGAGAIVLILLRAFAYSQQLQQGYHQIGERLASVEGVEDRLTTYRSSAATVGEDPLEAIDGIEFRTVSYSYGQGSTALDAVSFSVDRGEMIGVVGPSGAGKSTLVQILLRLRPPGSGRYLINGRDADSFAEGDWARLVSFLPQQPKLVAGTVAENIRFLREASDDAVESAARMAHIHDEIISWPEGYGTIVGHRSDALSGGQAQRVCLARALLTSPSLLVLDEPTSALDAMSEHHVQNALASLRGRTTTFIVAHRLSTLSMCDRILVLKNGRVEAMETGEQLAQSGGFYQDALRLSGMT